MNDLREIARRGRKALGMPPRDLARRLLEEAARKTRRPLDRVRPALFGERALLKAAGAASIDDLWTSRTRAPFVHADPPAAAAAAFRERFSGSIAAVLERAERAVRHEFDLLGSGPVTFDAAMPWRTDFKTGREWPRQYCHAIAYAELDRPTDVKVPWELSRFQHLPALGQAYALTCDDRFAREFVAQVGDWIADNPYAYSVNWSCAMDVALRAISWIWGFRFFAGAPACADRDFRSLFLRSLFLHGEFVAANIERSDINGNHYLTDGAGLVCLGAFFHDSRSGQAWLQAGRDIVVGEVVNQISEDGVDFEQSVAYHRLVLEAFLTAYLVLEGAGVPAPAPAWQRVERMCEFVEAYTKPDGRVPLVGDADDGRIQQLGLQPIGEHRYLLSTGAAIFGRGDFKCAATRLWEETFWLLGVDGMRRFDDLAGVPGPGASRGFPVGGFYVLRAPDVHIFIDAGEVGMRGRGGHGHNDVTSFELFLNGMNVVSDCGAYVYTASREWRDRFRSTAFHNVVQVDGQELNRFISPEHMWSLQYDARPVDLTWETGGDVEWLGAGHTGYERLDHPVHVRRELALDRRHGRVVLRDTLTSDGPHDCCWRFHFDPDVRPDLVEGDVRVSAGNRSVWLMPAGTADAPAVLEETWVSPSYGVRRPSMLAAFRERTSGAVRRIFIFSAEPMPPHERGSYAESILSLCAKS